MRGGRCGGPGARGGPASPASAACRRAGRGGRSGRARRRIVELCLAVALEVELLQLGEDRPPRGEPARLGQGFALDERPLAEDIEPPGTRQRADPEHRARPLGTVEHRGVEALHLRVLDRVPQPVFGRSHAVDRQHAQDQVVGPQAGGGGEQELQPLTGLAAGPQPAEQVVVAVLVGQHRQHGVARTAAEDRAETERGMGREPQRPGVRRIEPQLAAP